MKSLRQVCAVATLTLVLALHAFAGDIGFPGSTNPPPRQQSSATGQIRTPGTPATDDSSELDTVAIDPVTDAALTLLQGLLSFF